MRRPPKRAGALTSRQQRFVAEYLVDLNATKAAIRAGYSAKTAHSIGPRMLEFVGVADAIAAAMARRAQRTEITQDVVLKEAARIAFSDMRSFLSWGPDGVHLVDSASLAEDDTRSIAEVSETVTKDGGTRRIKLHDKVAALDKLMRHLGMLKDRVELSGRDGTPLIPLATLREAIRLGEQACTD